MGTYSSEFDGRDITVLPTGLRMVPARSAYFSGYLLCCDRTGAVDDDIPHGEGSDADPASEVELGAGASGAGASSSAAAASCAGGGSSAGRPMAFLQRLQFEAEAYWASFNKVLDSSSVVCTGIWWSVGSVMLGPRISLAELSERMQAAICPLSAHRLDPPAVRCRPANFLAPWVLSSHLPRPAAACLPPPVFQRMLRCLARRLTICGDSSARSRVWWPRFRLFWPSLTMRSKSSGTSLKRLCCNM